MSKELSDNEREAMDNERDISDMFQDDQNQGVMDAMGELAADIAVKQASLKEVEACVKDMKDILSRSEAKLAEMMTANNCKNGHKFDNGCFPEPYATTEVFKSGGVEDEDLFKWLRDHNLGDIVKEQVHWKSLSSTMKEYLELNDKDLPDIFNIKRTPKIKFKGNGHIKFLETLGKDGE